jgi:hypothetical protein
VNFDGQATPPAGTDYLAIAAGQGHSLALKKSIAVTLAFDPDSGAHPGSSVQVTVTCSTADATIRYTTDGSDPTETSASVASGDPVAVPVPGMLKATAFKTGMNPSAIRLATYTSAVVHAWRPSGWVYMDWPWAYDSTSGEWHWFNTGAVQWVYGYPPAGGWMPMGASGLARNWTYYAWPFMYSLNRDAWFYVNESDQPWCVKMSTGAWSRFGVEQ